MMIKSTLKTKDKDSKLITSGFTLIELLAVIVILAIIALIATPIVLNIIEDSKDSSKLNSANHYLDAVSNAIMSENMNNGGSFIPVECKVQNDGNLKCDGKDITVEVDGEKPTSGIITFESGNIVNVEFDYGGNKNIINDKNGTLIYAEPLYQNGDEIYYDVLTGEGCTNYHKDNSLTGYNGISTTATTGNQNSCLKFYAFNDEKENKILNLLLDHNTTASLAWNSKSNATGPSIELNQLLGKLKIDTSAWVGTIEPINYEYKGIERPYTVNYSGYKARLITAQEIAQITGADKSLNWDETLSSSEYYYFYDLSQEVSQTGCGSEGCIYGWLYDRTHVNCTKYGCLNDSNEEIFGYWTVSASTSDSYFSWAVHISEVLESRITVSNIYGVRPVITILKSQI